MTKREFFDLVKRHNAGDADATRKLRAYADRAQVNGRTVRDARALSSSRGSVPASTPVDPSSNPGVTSLRQKARAARARAV
jgi:hypothetical protein